MRPAKLLERLIADAIVTTGGAMPLDLLAEDETEAEALRKIQKGKRGAKSINVRVARPGELTPNLHWR